MKNYKREDNAIRVSKITKKILNGWDAILGC